MLKKDIEAQAQKFGEVFVYYHKLRQKGSTYLEGTMDFSDKYISARFAKEQPKPADDEHILIFSRTNDSFRYIPVKKVFRVTSLNAELDRATPFGRRR